MGPSGHSACTRRGLANSAGQQHGTWYLYGVHDLEFAGVIPLAARSNDDVATALFEHLALNWDVLARFQTARGAFVPSDQADAAGEAAAPARTRLRGLANLIVERRGVYLIDAGVFFNHSRRARDVLLDVNCRATADGQTQEEREERL